MRPVRLNMTGFGSFREPTEVDFAGADYFALVGPTGAGKSTVIDAMTFALYGTVPRWDHKSKVAFALSPTVNRGTVRLVFDVGGARYLVARELRRSGGANPQVSVKNARLERLLDPAGLGEVGEPVEQLAADSLVTPRVEQLLGLEFDHFCTCVSLPQGDFAEFLHAKPADRQRILTKLLGLGIYETIAREAGAEGARQSNRATFLAEQILDFFDVTDQAQQAAADRVAELETLSSTVDEAVPLLVVSARAVAEHMTTVARIEGERDRLTALTIPAGVDELDGRRVRAAELLAATDAELTAAEQRDTAAREARIAAPERGPLEQARRDHAGLSIAVGAEPTAAEAYRQAGEQAVAAETAAREATVVAAAAREREHAAGAGHETAQTIANGLAREREQLASVRPPSGLAELGRVFNEALETLAVAKRESAEAQQADDDARAALAAAPARGPLEQASADHAELAEQLEKRPVLEAAYAQAASEHDAATDLAEQAQSHLSHLRDARNAAARTDLAAALRPQLSVGDDCPVCTQQVTVLPPPLVATHLEAAERALARADRDLMAAQRAETAAERAAAKAESDRDSVVIRISFLRATLVGGPPTQAAAGDALAALDLLGASTAAADARLRNARNTHDKAVANAEKARAARDAASQSLLATRDPLVALGAPVLGNDVVADWAALLDWARQETARRDEQLTTARVAVAEAAGALTSAGVAKVAAEAAEAQARQEETRTVGAAERAKTKLEALAAEINRLQLALKNAPDQQSVTEELARLDRLDAAAADADSWLLKARSQREAALIADQRIRVEIAAGRKQLSAARDPLVEQGAPPTPGDELLTDWTALVSWAHTEAAARTQQLAAEQAERDDRQRGHDAAAMTLTRALTDAGVTFRRDVVLTDAAGPAIAAGLAQARATGARLAERRRKAEQLQAEQVSADEDARVAQLLAKLLKSDNFPRWLVASALDVLVVEASASLADLSGGQFELTHDNGEFLIVDHADADSRRPVRTLSGGETFQASLALALALSSQMATLAAAGAARLDSIFLDEGFGTLDESTLEVVAATLENLASHGDRMVGVITHVGALAERIPVRFTVKRDQLGSTVMREGL